MVWKNFELLKVKSKEDIPLKPRYNVTSDIVGFERCSRQYGFFNKRGYVPSHTTQLYFGTIIHEVLDKAHRHYREFGFPEKHHIENYFYEVQNKLYAQGIRSFSLKQKDLPLDLLIKFNDIEKHRLYPRVIDTEHRLQGSRQSYIIEGVVDVLSRPKIDHAKAEKIAGYDDVEIWDYKGTRFPKKKELAIYEYQMLVYAALYKMRKNVYPRKAVLYFINELHYSKDGKKPPKAEYQINIPEKDIDGALIKFDQIAASIQKCKDTNTWNPPSGDKLPLKDTCAVCDIRWSCPSYRKTDEGSREYPLFRA